MAEISDSYKGQEPHPPVQSDMVMFAPSNAGESKQSEKPRRRTFEDIRAENRKHRVHANQEPSHVPHDHNTDSEWEVCYIATLYILCTILFVQWGNPSLHKEVLRNVHHEETSMVT